VKPFSWSLLGRGGLAVLFVTLAVALTLLVPPLDQAPYALFFAAVVATAWYGGSWASLLATTLSILALDFFFLSPRYALGTDLPDSVRLGAFLFGGVLTSLLMGARERMEESLRQRERRKGEFLALIAHELRNFLSPMTASVHVLRTPEAPEDTAERCLEIVERQVHNMSRLVSDLLDAARLEQGKLRLCKEPVDLTAVVAQTVEAVRPQIEACGHKLTVHLPLGPLCLEADPTRLEQILLNLLINAARYTNPGGRIAVKLGEVQGEAEVRIRDTGAGIPAEKLGDVFDLFVQLGEGGRKGLGVGLSLVRGLARLHGGDVMVRSDGPGQGSEFVVRLPLAASVRP
jgi:signal transduction histidine kinase